MWQNLSLAYWLLSYWKSCSQASSPVQGVRPWHWIYILLVHKWNISYPTNGAQTHAWGNRLTWVPACQHSTDTLKSVLLLDSVTAHFFMSWQSLTTRMWPSRDHFSQFSLKYDSIPKQSRKTHTEHLYAMWHFHAKLHKQLCQIITFFPLLWEFHNSALQGFIKCYLK